MVVGKEALSENTFSSHDSTNAVQVDRQTNRGEDKNDSTFPSFLWTQHYCQMEVPRSYENRGVQESPFTGNSQGDRRLYYQAGHKPWPCRSIKGGHRLNSPEANMSYPSDATLMKKLALMAYKLLKFLKENKEVAVSTLEIDIKAIVKKFQQYIFMAKNTLKEKKQQVFKEYHILVKAELRAFVSCISGLPPEYIESLPWNYRDAAELIAGDAWRYLLDVGHFVRTGTIKTGKILSLKMRDVVCVVKGKIGKDKEFGRVIQLGRIGGNFLIPYLCTSLRMDDKECLPQIIMEHCAIFSKTQQVSVSTDKGYYSEYNVDFVEAMTGSADGVQRPVNVKNQVETPQKEELYNRRAGVEPLIGHAKEFGLRKSRMKSDEATLASGYRSVTGFNLHQLIGHLEGSPQAMTV